MIIFVDAVVPAGAIDGNNTHFFLSPPPNPAASLVLESDSSFLAPNVGFTLDAFGNLDLSYAPVQSLIAWYRGLIIPAPPGGDHFIPKASPLAGPVQNIPLDNKPNQVWEVTVLVNGIPVTISVILRYNEIARYWVATIRDSDGNIVLDSLPFVTGEGISQNLLGQFVYLGIGSATVFNASELN